METAIPDRLREEAKRPLRWIIESAKFDRRKELAAKAEPAASSARTKIRAVANAPVPKEAPSTAPAATAVAIEAAPHGHANVAELRPVPASAAPPAPPPSVAPAPPKPIAVAALTPPPPPPPPVKAPAPPKEDVLVALSQEPPEVWSGLCMGKCDRYFFRVTFKVLPSGQVDDVRLVESNYPRLRNEVLAAVAKWRYQPIAAARNEEIVLRLVP